MDGADDFDPCIKDRLSQNCKSLQPQQQLKRNELSFIAQAAKDFESCYMEWLSQKSKSLQQLTSSMLIPQLDGAEDFEPYQPSWQNQHHLNKTASQPALNFQRAFEQTLAQPLISYQKTFEQTLAQSSTVYQKSVEQTQAQPFINYQKVAEQTMAQPSTNHTKTFEQTVSQASTNYQRVVEQTQAPASTNHTKVFEQTVSQVSTSGATVRNHLNNFCYNRAPAHVDPVPLNVACYETVLTQIPEDAATILSQNTDRSANVPGLNPNYLPPTPVSLLDSPKQNGCFLSASEQENINDEDIITYKVNFHMGICDMYAIVP